MHKDRLHAKKDLWLHRTQWGETTGMEQLAAVPVSCTSMRLKRGQPDGMYGGMVGALCMRQNRTQKRDESTWCGMVRSTPLSSVRGQWTCNRLVLWNLGGNLLEYPCCNQGKWWFWIMLHYKDWTYSAVELSRLNSPLLPPSFIRPQSKLLVLAQSPFASIWLRFWVLRDAMEHLTFSVLITGNCYTIYVTLPRRWVTSIRRCHAQGEYTRDG